EPGLSSAVTAHFLISVTSSGVRQSNVVPVASVTHFWPILHATLRSPTVLTSSERLKTTHLFKFSIAFFYWAPHNAFGSSMTDKAETDAYKRNRGPSRALDFATRSPSFPLIFRSSQRGNVRFYQVLRSFKSSASFR